MLFSNPTLIAVRNTLSSHTSIASSQFRYTGLVWCIAVALPFVLAAQQNPTTLLLTFFLALLTMQCWQFTFAPSRHNLLPSPYTIVYAMLYSLLLPLSISMWALVLCVSFGSVFGERVFGGRGFAFLHPVTVGLAFYLFSNPIALGSAGASLIPVGLIAGMAVALCVLDLVSWRTLLGIAIGFLFTAWITNMQDLPVLLGSGGILLSLILLAGDPGSGGSTNPSRWLHGALSGSLLVFLYSQTSAAMHATVFAILLASLSAPLLDHLVVLVHTTRRRHRYE